MVVNGYRYGISLLPDNCIAYREGYRYGAYKQNLQDKGDMHITEFFKSKDEIQEFKDDLPEQVDANEEISIVETDEKNEATPDESEDEDNA